MINFAFSTTLIFLSSFLNYSAKAIELNVMTFNVWWNSGYTNPQAILNEMQERNPSIIGTQEVVPQLFDFLNTGNPYTGFGDCRDPGRACQGGAERSSIFESSSWSETWSIVKSDTFQLGVRGVGGFDYDRVATWGRYVRNSNPSDGGLCFFNTHLDTNAGLAEKSFIDIMGVMKSQCDFSRDFVMITGDFNVQPDHYSLGVLTRDGFNSTVNANTFGGIKLDFIFYRNPSSGFRCNQEGSEETQSSSISDHRGLHAKFVCN